MSNRLKAVIGIGALLLLLFIGMNARFISTRVAQFLTEKIIGQSYPAGQNDVSSTTKRTPPLDLPVLTGADNIAWNGTEEEDGVLVFTMNNSFFKEVCDEEKALLTESGWEENTVNVNAIFGGANTLLQKPGTILTLSCDKYNAGMTRAMLIRASAKNADKSLWGIKSKSR